MMRGFPVPYPDELIYSMVARAGIRFAITSPKQLLDEVFDDRKVIATLDLPSHLSAISAQLANTEKFELTQLIYNHTMFPIYAPFIDENIRTLALKRMQGCSKGSIHLMLGAVASIIKTSDILRVCPKCVLEQEYQYGEKFWSRLWYLPGLPYCPNHGVLNLSDISHHDSRHSFHACGRVLCEAHPLSDAKPDSSVSYLTSKAQELLYLPCQSSPTKHQWSQFYSRLAHEFGCGIGSRQVSHNKVFERVITKFTLPDLVVDFTSDTNWLRSIFRKHRKAFSYLQHLTVWSAFVPDMSVDEIIKRVKASDQTRVAVTESVTTPDTKTVMKNRKNWQDLISTTQIKKARTLVNGGALYAWLYRNDRDWLLSFNRLHQSLPSDRKNKVDWHTRDRKLTKYLLGVINQLDSVIEGPRRSKSFLLKQLNHSSSISKKLFLLPILSSVLNRYQETVLEFQARRLVISVIKQKHDGGALSRWQLIRTASLPKERILPIIDNLLNWVVIEKSADKDI
ncbi:TnsD family Tn7-like transposition protein [Moritella viscosa]|uniref:Transposition protein n=1 Tax=Moritella viscosa TaxID=80854 RepID=A0A1L0CLN4_9GAMM|nr:TnsD family Tn7-like transposition protein [Moritella viscosa]SGZ18700.1 Transposition protein [Moritella viscosa]SHO14445.1 Transposition protein [Moritella viscosa]SHO15389.1 Transposition protein [Moritella viscosa]SHO18982.1 Transposition protein [Moritella viscosa]